MSDLNLYRKLLFSTYYVRLLQTSKKYLLYKIVDSA